MCTALKYGHVMGRNFDYEISYGEELVKIPRHEYGNDYSIIGICTMYKDANGVFPLLYDGMNEYGLCMAGLAFEGNANYMSVDRWQQQTMKTDLGIGAERAIPVYRFIFDVLRQCRSVKQALRYIDKSVLIDKQISLKYPNSDMHWFICDKDESYVIEQTKDGLEWYRAETDVLTNNPPYPQQIAKYTANKGLVGRFIPDYHTRGVETELLNGSYTSAGRFQRVSYLKEKLEQSGCKADNVTQGFHLLGSVEQLYGATPVNDKFEYTIYSVVYDMSSLIAYVKIYNNLAIRPIFLPVDFENEPMWHQSIRG